MKKLISMIITILLISHFIPFNFLFAAEGPAQPEAAQFEPIDTSDIVNLYSGNFTYNVPLLEVPGPEGSWPINMCYHAGVGPNTEATWLGLGWTLNAGSINRFLSGYPDDYWNGSVISEYDIQVTGSGIGLSISYGPVGMSMNFDSQRGFGGINTNIKLLRSLSLVTGVDFEPFTENSPLGFDVSLQMGSSGVGLSTSLGLGAAGESGIGGSLGISAGVHTSQKPSFSSYGGMSYSEKPDNSKLSNSMSLMGVSYSAGNSGANFSAAGTGFQSQAGMEGSGHFSSTSLSFSIPVGFLVGIPGLSLGLSYYEWEWRLHELHIERSFGVLHQLGMVTGFTDDQVYSLSEVWGEGSGNIYDDAVNYYENNIAGPRSVGTRSTPDIFVERKFERNEINDIFFTSEDAFQVNAQGLAGSFKPFMNNLYRIYDLDEDNTSLYSSYDEDCINNGANILFRFQGDQGSNFAQRVYMNEWTERIRKFPYSPGEDIRNYFGSKKIEPAIHPVSGLLIGFRITAEDGKIYEFFRPVISYYQYTETKDGSDENINEMRTPYATSWMLTGIKGPDYVDMGEAGFSADDFGFWIHFRYKESDSFTSWRTPWEIGTYSDAPDGSGNETYSFGCRRQIYLESIETASHISFFNKESRLDNLPAKIEDCKIAAANIEPSNYYSQSYTNTKFTFPFDRNEIENSFDNANFILKVQCHDIVLWQSIELDDSQFVDDDDSDNIWEVESIINFMPDGDDAICGYLEISPDPGNLLNTPNSSERLNSIVVKNKILREDGSYKTDYIESENPDNPTIESVEFEQDYLLAKGAENSDSNNNGDTGDPDDAKLTLTGFQKKGLNGTSVLPRTLLTYYRENTSWNINNWDYWNGYTSVGNNETHFNIQDTTIADIDASTWNLKEIYTPLGATIKVEYESDEIKYIGNDDKLDFAFEPTRYNITPYTQFTAIIDQECIDFMDACLENDRNIYLLRYYYGNNYEITKIGNFTIDYDDNNNYINFETSLLGNNWCDFDIFAFDKDVAYLGGHRVKSVEMDNGDQSLKTNYNYVDGVLTILPSNYEYIVQTEDEKDDDIISPFLYSAGYNILGPGPSVGYETVEVMEVDSETGGNLSGKTVNHFYSPRSCNLNIIITPGEDDTLFVIDDRTGLIGRPKKIEVYGFDPVNEFYLLKKDEFNYCYSDEITVNAGGSEQRQIYRYLDNTGDDGPILDDVDYPLGYTEQYHLSRDYIDDALYKVGNEKQNIFMTGTRSATYFYNDDFTVCDSIIVSTENLGYDAYSGAVIATVTKDSKHNKKYSEKIPAYWKYQGLKDKNMLTQLVGEIGYTVDPEVTDNYWDLKNNDNLNDYLTSSTITTWNNWGDADSISLWRQNDTYTFIGDPAEYEEFSCWTGDPGDFITNATTGYNIWKRTSNIENYDRYGHPIEEKGIDGVYSSAIYGYEDALPTAIVSNAKVNEIGYESYENESDINGWSIYCEANQQIVDTEFHNGKHSIEIISSIEDDPSTGSSNMIYKNFPGESLDLNKKYTFSAWVKAYQIDECMQFIQLKIKFRDHNDVWISPEQSQAQYSQENLGEWTYLECSIDLSQYSSQYSIILIEPYIVNYGSSEIPCYIDDIRFYPSDANMSTYTYDPLTWKLTSITDANNVSSYYEYDDAGRLIKVYNQDKYLLKQYDYYFGRNQE